MVAYRPRWYVALLAQNADSQEGINLPQPGQGRSHRASLPGQLPWMAISSRAHLARAAGSSLGLVRKGTKLPLQVPTAKATLESLMNRDYSSNRVPY